jgi:hypothetical protein
VHGIVAFSILGGIPSDAPAQTATSSRTVSVEGRAMRVWTSGLEGRQGRERDDTELPRSEIARLLARRSDRGPRCHARWPFARSRRCHDAPAIRHQNEWALASPKRMFVTAGHVGQMVHRDEPAMVVRLVDFVLHNVISQSK